MLMLMTLFASLLSAPAIAATRRTQLNPSQPFFTTNPVTKTSQTFSPPWYIYFAVVFITFFFSGSSSHKTNVPIAQRYPIFRNIYTGKKKHYHREWYDRTLVFLSNRPNRKKKKRKSCT